MQPSASRNILQVAAMICMGALAGCHDERTVELNEVSPLARTTIAQVAGNGEITKITEERKDGKIHYHVVVRRDGKESKHTVEEGGQLRD
jgi:hypothetical protein